MYLLRRNDGKYAHLTPYVLAMTAADSSACLLLLYQIATLAPASARASATARPMPAPAPETIAVLPLSEKRGSTRSTLGTGELSCLKAPLFISAILNVFPVIKKVAMSWPTSEWDNLEETRERSKQGGYQEC